MLQTTQRKYKMKLILLMMAMLCASCAATIPEIRTETVIVDTSCSWAKTISISVNDNITDGTARQVLAHNRLVNRNCPPK